MVEITLGEVTKKLRYSHIAIKSIEQHYKMGINKVFNEVDMESIENIGVFLWAGMKRYEQSLQLEDVEELIDDALEEDQITYEELGEKIQEAFKNSSIAKTGKKTTSKNKTGA